MTPDNESNNGAQPQQLLWGVREAATRLSVSPVTIRKLIRQQRLPRVPNIRKLLIPETALQRFANSAQ
jgi:excisionase family DNA binding protein